MSLFVKMIQFITGKVLSLDSHAYRELRDGPKLLSFPFSVPTSLFKFMFNGQKSGLLHALLLSSFSFLVPASNFFLLASGPSLCSNY